MTPSCAFAPRTFPPRASHDGRGCFHRAGHGRWRLGLTRDARVSALGRARRRARDPRAAPHPSSLSRARAFAGRRARARRASRAPRPRRPHSRGQPWMMPRTARAGNDFRTSSALLLALTPHARSLTSPPPRGSLQRRRRAFYDKRIGAEVEGSALGDEYKVPFKTGRQREAGPHRQGVLTASRVFLLAPGHLGLPGHGRRG